MNKFDISLLYRDNTIDDVNNLLKENQDKIKWSYLSKNSVIFELDYDFFYQRMDIIRKELIEKTWHPKRFKDWCLDIDELKELC